MSISRLISRHASNASGIPTLAHGQIDVAVETGVLRAACHLGIGNVDQARQALRDLYIRELDPSTALEGTTIDVRSLAVQIRVEVSSGARHAVTFRSTPSGAHVTIDGGSNECARTPCRVTLIEGTHMITAGLGVLIWELGFIAACVDVVDINTNLMLRVFCEERGSFEADTHVVELFELTDPPGKITHCNHCIVTGSGCKPPRQRCRCGPLDEVDMMGADLLHLNGLRIWPS